MKLFKCLAVASAAVVLLSSSSILKQTASNALSSGTNTGSALSSLYKILKATGTLDLSDLTTLVNIGKILTGANAVADATSTFTGDFITGLIDGSANLVNNSNANTVVNALKGLAGIDTSTLAKAATAAAKGTATQVNSSAEDVASTLSSLTSILNLLN